MSIKNISRFPSLDTSSLQKAQLPAEYNEVSNVKNFWKRNPSWILISSSSGNSVTGLYAVYPNVDNFLAISATTSTGTYTVSYESNSVNTASNTVTYLNLDYNSVDLNNTDGPVSFLDFTFSRYNHGYDDGDTVRFYNITHIEGFPAPPLVEGQVYYVVNSALDTFEISSSVGGSPINMGTSGAATLLPYKISTIDITATTGNLLTVNLSLKHNNLLSTSTYTTGWLDLQVNSSTLTNLVLTSGAPLNVRHQHLENIDINNIGPITSFSGTFSGSANLSNVNISSSISNVTNMSSMFSGCGNLLYVNFGSSTSSVTNTSSMFRNCNSLRAAPFFDTSNVTDMNNMFNGCKDLDELPLYDMGKVTNASSMFSGCNALKNIPPFDLKNLLNMESMFTACVGLKEVPLMNTSKVTNMRSAFSACGSLKTLPLLDTSSVTNMGLMFLECSSLQSIPRFNTSNVNNMFQTFYGCRSLKSIPLLNTSNVTSMSQTFFECFQLETIPQFDLSSALSTSNMFFGCRSLTTIPLINTSNATDMSSMFGECYSLTSVPLLDTSKATLINAMFTGCSSLRTVPKFDLALATNANNMFANCTSLESVPIFNMPLANNLGSMFSGCTNLKNIPKMNIPGATSVNAMFTGCSNLIRVPDILPPSNLTTSSTSLANLFNGCLSLSKMEITGLRYAFGLNGCRLNKNALDEVFSNLLRVITPTQTLNITGNYGSDAPVTKTGCGITTGSKIVTIANTSNLIVGQRVTGTGVNTSISVTLQDSGDTVTYVSHGLSNGTIVYFTAINSTTGISTYTGYYVINAGTDTFQLSLTNGGSALPLTTNGSGTMFYPSYIESIDPNVSITMTAPASQTNASASLAFKVLDTYPALVKGWSITG